MDLPGQLASDIAALLDGFGGDHPDVNRHLGAFRTALALAVPSYCSLTLRLVVSAMPITLQIVEPGVTATARSSLFVPLDGQGFGASSSLIIFASTPGALVDLAADLAYALRLGDHILVDKHRATAPTDSGLRGIAEMSVINYAVGILIAQGHEPDEARTVLRAMAADRGATEQSVAEDLVARSRMSDPTEPTSRG